MSFFGNDDPYRHKKPTEVLDVVVTRLRAKFRRRTTRRLGGVWKQKINKHSNIV